MANNNFKAIYFGKGCETIVTRTKELENYYRSIKHFPRLTEDEEVELSYQIKAGDEKAREKFINCNLCAVVSVVKSHYSSYGGCLTTMDLVSAGNIGLMKAVEKFDPTMGFKFLSFAVNEIRSAISDEIKRNARLVKNYHGSSPISHTSLDEPVSDDDTTPLSDVMCTSTDSESFLNESLAADLMRVINSVLRKDIEINIMCSLWGIGRPKKKRWEVAEELKITEERVRQIEYVSIQRIKNNPKAKEILSIYFG